MAAVTPPRPLVETDDRDSFDCGRELMNHWFRRHGWANHAAGVSRVNVIFNAQSGQIVGYVTLSAAQIERSNLAKAHQRNKPDPLPATLLGQLAVRKDCQGRGYASSLPLFALRQASNAMLRARSSVALPTTLTVTMPPAGAVPTASAPQASLRPTVR